MPPHTNASLGDSDDSALGWIGTGIANAGHLPTRAIAKLKKLALIGEGNGPVESTTDGHRRVECIIAALQ